MPSAESRTRYEDSLECIAKWIVDDYYGNRSKVAGDAELGHSCWGMVCIRDIHPSFNQDTYRKIAHIRCRRELREFLETEAAIANVTEAAR